MARTHTATRTGETTRPRSHVLFQHILRIIQFLSAFISLILFSLRIAKVIRLAGRATRSNGAVEGILAAAVLYTLIAMLLQLGIRGTSSNMLRILFIILDVLFVGAFIAVAILTSPKRHGSSAPCTSSPKVNKHIPGNVNCSLPWGTFILAIVSTLLHAITVGFHAHRDHRRERRQDHIVAKEEHHNHDSLDAVDGQNGYNRHNATRV